MAATAEWFYKRGGEEVGPVTLEQLSELFKGHQLGSSTMVWGDAFKRWVPASSIAAFRAMCGDVGDPGTGGVLEYKEGGEGPVGIGGWLLIPAIGRVVGPLTFAAAAVGCWRFGERWQGQGLLPTAMPADWMAKICLAWGGYELVTSVLFFAKRRVVVPAIIGLQVLGVVYVVMSMWFGWTPRPRGVTEEGWWAVQVGPMAMWAFVWSCYFLVSGRVRGTFVK